MLALINASVNNFSHHGILSALLTLKLWSMAWTHFVKMGK